MLRRLGDVLLATPLIRSLRRAWPGAKIDALVFSGTAGILRGNPDIDRIITVAERPSVAATLRLLGSVWKRYELAVSTQPGDRPTLFALAAGRMTAGVFDGGGKLGDGFKGWALHRKTPVAGGIHRVEQMLRLADAIGIERVPEVVCPAAAPQSGLSIGADYAVIHAAPMFRYKQWTREGWRMLARSLAQRGLEVIALSGPDPAEREYLTDVWRGLVPLRPAPWPETVALLRAARVYIGPDTSVSHLAAATGCPSVVLFGPMDPQVWGPWPAGGLTVPWVSGGTIQRRGNVWVVQHPLPCLPCTFEGCERHINSYSRCLDELPASHVIAAVDEALSSRPFAPMQAQ